MVAAVVCLCSGVYEATRRPPVTARAPAAAAALRPLRALPVAAGTTVALLLPGGATEPQRVHAWLYEAAWQRPDLRWALPAPTAVDSFRNLVAVGIASPGAGWRLVWRRGDVSLFTRATT